MQKSNSVKLGQNFLINKNVAKKIVMSFFPVKGIILEIGPGKGILTDLLIKHRAKNKITAIEIDIELHTKYQSNNIKNFEITNTDILDVKLNNMSVKEKFNLIGNIPFYISKELINWVISQQHKIKKGIFMMQREFVKKLSVKNKSKIINAQSVIFNYLFLLEKLFDVNPGSFHPKPKVTSSVFLFKKSPKKNKVNTEEYYTFLKICLKKRRKTLFNNLITKYKTEDVKKIFTYNKLNQKIRAEQLQVEFFLKIYKQLNHTIKGL